MWETIGTQKDYKHTLSTSSKLLAERAQAVKLTSQLGKAFNKLIGKIFFPSIITMLKEQGR